jgi:hypothetical protein
VKSDVARTLVSAASALMPTQNWFCANSQCGRQSCLQAAFQAAFPIPDEFLGHRRFNERRDEAGEIPCCMSSCADKSDVARTLVSAASALMPTQNWFCANSQCGRQSCLQAAFQAAFPIPDEFLGHRRFNERGHEAGEIPCCMSSCTRLDKLKHVPPSGADRSVRAADTSVRATSGATAHWHKWPKPSWGGLLPAMK